MHKDFLELLRLLDSHKVRFLIIGGYAFSLQVEPRYTKDLDIWIEATLQNGKRLLSALEEFGAPIANLTPSDIAKPGLLYIFGVPPLRVDILNRVSGRKFSTAYSNRVEIKVKKVTVPLVNLPDLTALKKAAGRAQDLVDLEKIKQYQKISKKSKSNNQLMR